MARIRERSNTIWATAPPHFESLAGARQFARQEGLPAWDIFHGNDRIEYHDPHDREMAEGKAKQDLWMCLLLNAPMHHAPS